MMNHDQRARGRKGKRPQQGRVGTEFRFDSAITRPLATPGSAIRSPLSTRREDVILCPHSCMTGVSYCRQKRASGLLTLGCVGAVRRGLIVVVLDKDLAKQLPHPFRLVSSR